MRVCVSGSIFLLYRAYGRPPMQERLLPEQEEPCIVNVLDSSAGSSTESGIPANKPK